MNFIKVLRDTSPVPKSQHRFYQSKRVVMRVGQELFVSNTDNGEKLNYVQTKPAFTADSFEIRFHI